MVENVLSFRPRERIFGPAEKYIDPKYRKQIQEWDKTQGAGRGKKIAGAIKEVEKGNLLKALFRSLAVGGEIREEIEAGDTSAFPYLLILAILMDIVDPVPIVGLIVKFVAKPIVIYGTLFRGRMKYKYATKIYFWSLGITELIPGLNWLPLETVSVLMLWRATYKARLEKEAEEEENNLVVEAYSKKVNEKDLELYQINKEIFARVGMKGQTLTEAPSESPVEQKVAA